MGGKISLILPAAIVVVGIVLLAYARGVVRKGILR